MLLSKLIYVLNKLFLLLWAKVLTRYCIFLVGTGITLYFAR